MSGPGPPAQERSALAQPTRRQRVSRAALTPLNTARDALSTFEELAVAELRRAERRATSARTQLSRGVTQARTQAGRALPF
jgi:hypothetical protein